MFAPFKFIARIVKVLVILIPNMSSSLTKEMRIATREIHKLSDALVNAKLAFALNNSEVWADGLLVFYEVFKFLEENVPQDILPVEYHRTQQFENDLEFYKGNDWKNEYKIRESVQKYLSHLNEIQERNPRLLIAYVYHLYMGLLSGGQILAKKRRIANKFMQKFNEQKDDTDEIAPGSHLTSFPNKSIFELKNNFRQNIDEVSSDFNENLRQALIDESHKVFELNNEIIKSVEGVEEQLKKNLRNFIGCLLLVIFSLYLFVKMWKV
ncbi:CLUMA_CG000781, isoform A [Clunio marinus]|uniref:Heme oxygenase n=1 Tax=Clunio marinus TaxID=568069 RepID=A0A1J1HG10_9DIPT|nr:CLUMA_CG000781, isoform A [Clunio marinus]